MSKAYKCDFCSSFFEFDKEIPHSVRFGWGESRETAAQDICPACLAEIAREIDLDAGLKDTRLSNIRKKVMPYARPKMVKS